MTVYERGDDDEHIIPRKCRMNAQPQDEIGSDLSGMAVYMNEAAVQRCCLLNELCCPSAMQSTTRSCSLQLQEPAHYLRGQSLRGIDLD